MKTLLLASATFALLTAVNFSPAIAQGDETLFESRANVYLMSGRRRRAAGGR
jgi:hypothetical protein